MIEVTVLIVNYNAGNYLRRCVESVLEAECTTQIIVVDNASDDQSLAQISAYNEVLVLKQTENLGFAKAVNIGLENAQGEYVFLLNPDSYIFPDTLAQLVSVFRNHSTRQDIGVVGALVLNENGSEQRGCRRREPNVYRSMITLLGLDHIFSGVNMSAQPLPDAPIAVDAVSGAAMMLPKALFKTMGGLDERYFLHCEDLDICHSMKQQNYKVLFHPKSVVIHAKGMSSHKVASKVVQYKHQGMLSYYHKFYAKNKCSLAAMRALIYCHQRVVLMRSRLKYSMSSTAVDEDNSQPALPLKNLAGYKTVVITGADSPVADVVLNLLEQRDNFSSLRIFCLSRSLEKIPQLSGVHPNASWVHVNYIDMPSVRYIKSVDFWLHLAPEWPILQIADLMRPFDVKAVIAITAYNLNGNMVWPTATQRPIPPYSVQEQRLINVVQNNNTHLTLLRPATMYGGKSNDFVKHVRRVLRYLRFYPLLSEGALLQRPVHVDDVAQVVLSVMEAKTEPGIQSYDLLGSEVLSYRQIVERIAHQNNQRVVNLFHWPFSSSVKAHDTDALRNIADENTNPRIISSQKAQQALKFKPRSFQP